MGIGMPNSRDEKQAATDVPQDQGPEVESGLVGLGRLYLGAGRDCLAHSLARVVISSLTPSDL